MVTRTIQGNVVKRDALKQSVEVLKGLPVKEREELALREAIFEMLPEIEGVLDRGYSLYEVAGILSQNGVSIKGATLKQYLREGRKKRSRKRSRPSKAKGGLVNGGQGKGVGSEPGVAGSQGLKSRVDESGKETGTQAGKVAMEMGGKPGGYEAEAREPGGKRSRTKDSGGSEAKPRRTKGSGRTVGEFTEVPEDL